MIEKLNRVFEKLPPEHRDIMREVFTILIEYGKQLKEFGKLLKNWKRL